MSLRERAQSAKTLICFLQSLIGETATIELRNDSKLTGLILNVDAFMNVEMKNVKLSTNKESQTFDYYFVKGSRVRYVYFNEQIDVISNINEQLKIIQSVSRPERKLKEKIQNNNL